MAEPITGSRKRATAKIFLQPGTGLVKINGRKPIQYFGRQELVDIINTPLVTAGVLGTMDITARVMGGGIAGQAGAISLGIAKALVKHNPDFRASLKSAGLLRRDPREKERMKYGHAKRRKRFQFSKR